MRLKGTVQPTAPTARESADARGKLDPREGQGQRQMTDAGREGWQNANAGRPAGRSVGRSLGIDTTPKKRQAIQRNLVLIYFSSILLLYY